MSTENVTVKSAEEKTNPKLAAFYGIGSFGGQIGWYMVNNYLTLFYTDVVGLTATAISLIMLVARLWDTVNDPMMGMISDRTNTRWGRFRPYLMFAPPFLAIFNLLTFTVFPVQGALKTVLCLVFYIGSGMLYTIVGTAYNSLVNVIAKDSQIRMNLLTVSGFFSSISGIVLSALAMPLILFFGHSEVATSRGYFCTTLLFSLLMIPCYWITAAGCKEKYGQELHINDKKEKESIFGSLKNLIRNDQMVLTVAATILSTIAGMGRATMLSYYVIYVVGSYTMIAPIFTAQTIGQLVGTFLIPFGTKKMGKKGFLILMQCIMIIGFVTMFLFPLNHVPYLLAVSFVIGITNCAPPVVSGLISDSIDYGDWKFGVREEGLSVSFLSFGVKLATTVVGVFGVQLLSLTGYVPNAEQTASALRGINIVVNLVPAICGGLGLIPLAFYKLTNKRVAEIQADLQERKARELAVKDAEVK